MARVTAEMPQLVLTFDGLIGDLQARARERGEEGLLTSDVIRHLRNVFPFYQRRFLEAFKIEAGKSQTTNEFAANFRVRVDAILSRPILVVIDGERR